MAELTIAQLTELLAAGVDNADLLPIWDTTALETKKITISNFRTAVGVTNWAESFSSATQATSRWTPSNAAANVNAAIVPKGTGAITAAIPDGTTAGGNARGIYAVDLQLVRNTAAKVASGTYSAILSGTSNTASGDRSVVLGGNLNGSSGYCAIAGGESNNASGSWCIALGESNTSNGYACVALGRGNNNAGGGGGDRGSFVIGFGNTANYSEGGGALGKANTASNFNAIAIGQSSTASANVSFAFGATCTASAVGAVAIGNTNTASATYSTTGGGISNTASGAWSKIGGGASNTAAGYYNFIGGGFTNSGTANAAVTTQSATTTNASTAVTLAASNSNILVGQYITGTGIASDTYVAAISGTSLTLSKNATASGTNTLSFFAAHGVVVGGGNNQAVGTHSFIGGGGDAGTASERNRVEGQFSAILGGRKNTIKATNYNGSPAYMTIGGGYNNLINDSNPSSGSAILGGTSNTITGSTNSVIGGGESNSITYGTRWNVIAGGRSNSISGENEPNYRTIGGGFGNSMGNAVCTISGGQSNATSSATYASIGGGQSNTASGNHSIVGGGQTNTASGSHSVVGGGQSNTASGNQSAVLSGNTNTCSGSSQSVICGGNNNSVAGQQSAICGGRQNSIGGGGDKWAFIGAGYLNSTASGNKTAIVGGQENTATADYSVVVGGQSNASSGNRSFIGCGERNTASGSFSSVMGGFYATANLYGQQAYAAGRFSANGDAQAHELIWRRLVAGAPVGGSELFLDGASVAAILPATNSVWHGIIDCVAICTATGDGTTVVGDVEATSYKVTIKRIGTATSLVGTVQEIGTTNADASMATAVFTIDNNDTNESLRIVFTSPATAGSTTNIRCVATFRGTQIQY